MSRPARPFYDEDDVPFVKPYYATAGYGLVHDFVRGHEIGEDLPPDPYPHRPLCADADPEVFFPGKGDNGSAIMAKRICKFCPVREECLQVGMHERFGIWGGKTERERRAIRGRRKPGRKPGVRVA